MTDPDCPCGTGLPYARCCGPLHSGASAAATAEALMRSRYSGYAVGATGYLLDTWDEAVRPAELVLDPRMRWTRLRVLDVVGGGADDDDGEVEFRAHYRLDDVPDVLHERSRFARRRGRWRYVDGTTP